MTPIQSAVRSFGMMWLLAMAGLVGLGMLIGSINTRGLLSEKIPERSGVFSVSRLQLLLATLVAASVYVSQALVAAETGRLPDVPLALLAITGTSNAFFLASKAAANIRRRQHAK